MALIDLMLETIAEACDIFDTKTEHISNLCKWFEDRNKKTAFYKVLFAKRFVSSKKKVQKRDIICAILGISFIEYDELIVKTVGIRRVYNEYYLYDVDECLLKKVRLHSNSLSVLCRLFNLELKPKDGSTTETKDNQ